MEGSFGRKEGSRYRERDCGGSAREEREDLDGPRGPLYRARGPRPESSSTQTARLHTVFCPPTDAPFLSLLHFPVALPTGEAGRSLGSARGARGWQPAIGSPTLTLRSGLGANLRIRLISRFRFLVFTVFIWFRILSSFMVICLVSGPHLLSHRLSHRFSSLKYIAAVYKPPAGGKH
jgi:hypothetical protein